MRSLHYFPLCPFSRKVRFLLAEKGLKFELVVENFWERRREFASLNPAMQVPVLSEPDNIILADSTAICEYIEKRYEESEQMLGGSLVEGAEIRRIVSWFDIKMFSEVTKYLINEKVVRFMTKNGAPKSEVIRAAKVNLKPHLEYIEYLTRENRYLAGNKITLADISAASHISSLDYLGEVMWSEYPKLKEWYVLIKSRPSFRAILADKVFGFPPPKCYSDLDF